MARMMPKRIDRAKFKRDSKRGMKDIILGRGMKRGGPRI